MTEKEQKIQNWYNSVKCGVVKIISSVQGSGFFAFTDHFNESVLVTAQHVVKNCKAGDSLIISWIGKDDCKQKTIIKIKDIIFDQGLDIAAIQFNHKIETPLKLDFTLNPLPIGKEVIFCGYPSCEIDLVTPVIQQGIIAGRAKVDTLLKISDKQEILSLQVYIIDGIVNKGNSGGPVLTEIHGELKVIGIITQFVCPSGTAILSFPNPDGKSKELELRQISGLSIAISTMRLVGLCAIYLSNNFPTNKLNLEMKGQINISTPE